VPALVQEFKYSSIMQAPRVHKVVLNIGLGEALQNNKALDAAVGDLAAISGQKPVITKAKKSIAAFKLRQGMSIGAMVDAIVWGKPATALKDSLHVGDEVILNGKLQSREWESKSGFTNVAHSISCEKLKVLRHANDEIKATAAAPTPAENHSGVAGSDNEELPF
jgi:hypothetical protein